MSGFTQRLARGLAPILSCALVACLGLLAPRGASAVDFLEFETGPVRPMALSADGSKLYAADIPDGRLQIFDVTNAGLIAAGSVQVGMEPCAVAVAPDGKVWVVNHLSDSVSIVDASSSPPRVVQTLLVGDEPRDIVFAGTTPRAFISTAHRGQHRTHASISTVPGAGDPQLTTEGIGRADVWVFNAASPGGAVGGTPEKIMVFFADTPRALAKSADGLTVYVAGFHSGNQTAAINEGFVCDGFQPGVPCCMGNQCPAPIPLFVSFPGGVEGPSDNAAHATAPETGLILKWNAGTGTWQDSAGVNWIDGRDPNTSLSLRSMIVFSLPDRDVFAVDADTLVTSATSFDHVGTTLFNMVVNPTNGKLYVSNTESPNHLRFEGPGVYGGSTVQGHLSESRVSVLSGAGSVAIRHLNKHLDYDQLFTDADPNNHPDPNAKNHSLATPTEMLVSGGKLYIAAFGSAKIGVIDTAALEADSFDPTVASADYIPTGGGPSGLAIDTGRNRLYVMTRFDNAVSVIDLATKATLQSVPMHNPEPPSVVEGRPFLYDAMATSGNGEASCASCHIFGDLDDLAWNLGDPDGAVSQNTQPLAVPIDPGSTLHPMKGPMTTQTLRGMATEGALHWRGDRVDGFFGLDPCTEPTGAPCDEEHSFKNFIVAFEGLVGKEGILDPNDMQKFTDFALQLTLPPNPVRSLDNVLNASQSSGHTIFHQGPAQGVQSDGVACNICHTLDPNQGFFGTGGKRSFEGETQNFKVTHLRNTYTKVGAFGMKVLPTLLPGTPTGEQVRAFGVLHDGTVDTVKNFLTAGAFTLNATQEDNLQQFIFAFDTDLAPIVGQQVTLDATNSAVANPRIDLLKARAGAAFNSLILGGAVKECDLIAKGTVGGVAHGWVYRPGSGNFDDDIGGTLSDASLRALASSDGPVTFTCVTPGSGDRAGINRDRDTLRDGQDNCADAANNAQTNTDADALGDACDQDDDNDAVLDAYETGTGIFVSAFDTGSQALVVDTDGDGFDDGAEVAAGTDPNNPLSFPLAPVPSLPLAALVGLGLALMALTWLRLQRRALDGGK